MKILFLTNLLPFPLDNGGKVKSFTTIKALKKAGHDVDLLCFTESKVGEEVSEQLSLLCNSITPVYIKLTTATNINYMMRVAMKSLFSRHPFSVCKYKSKKMESVITTMCQSESYDLIYYDHVQLFIYDHLINRYTNNITKILDEHNCEYIIAKRTAQNNHNFLKKLFLSLEWRKYRNFEKRAIQICNKVIVLSKEDRKYLSFSKTDNTKYSVIPIGVKNSAFIKTYHNSPNTYNIMFLGTLTWEPNNQGLLWFLKEVFPYINKTDKKIQLYIIGKSPGKELLKLANLHKNIQITGYVDSVSKYYDICDLMIVPLFIGSGQRVKIIEAFSYGMPVVSTSIGAEGLKYKHRHNILIGDNPGEFFKCINFLTNKPEQLKHIGLEGRKVYEQHYSQEAVMKNILDVVEKPVSSLLKEK